MQLPVAIEQNTTWTKISGKLCVSSSANLFYLWTKHYSICNALAIEQNMAWTKISGKLCVCKYICQSFFFMNETFCYNALASYRTRHGLN